jgi:uncharacterized protein YndB with AHSA1/START domain
MRSFTYTIHIDRSPEKVWAYMMDFSQAPRWRNLVRHVEVLTPGPVRVGSELKITFDIQGRQKTAISEVWALEPARRFGVRNTEQKVTGVFEYHLEPDGRGTRVAFSCSVQPRGYMWLLLPWLLRGNRMRYTEQLPRLKQEVEKEGV